MSFGNKENGFSIILLMVLFLIVVSIFSFIFIRKPDNTSLRCFIESPMGKNIYVENQAVITEASCDSELGKDGTVFKWTSDLDGILGTEMEMFVKANEISEGFHKITFSWEKDGKTLGSDSIGIEIRRERGVFDPEFSIAPDQFYIDSNRNDGDYFISVRNDGDGELDWTLEFTKPWIYSTMLKGVAPSDFTISIDFNKVSPGYYEEEAFFRSESSNLEKVVPISICHNPNKDRKINDKCYPFRD